jgi:hypothetical protein
MVPFALQLNAQTAQAIVAGSSALFLEMGQGDTYNGAVPPLQNSCAWSTGKAHAKVTDSRVGDATKNTEAGDLWVVWTTGTAIGGHAGTCADPGTDSLVDAYIKLDSTVGNRCFFANPACTLSTTAITGDTGASKLTPITETPLPSNVLSAFNNQAVNIAATDILPADAKFATYVSLAQCGPISSGSQFVGHGYGPGPVGTSISSSYDSSQFNVIDFNINSSLTDPISGNPVTSHVVVPVGASPELVVVNKTNTAAGGFGDPAVKNINRGTLALFLSNIFARTADLLPQAFAGSGGTYFAVTALSREMLSGTYRVMEHSIPNNKEIYRSQELGNCTNGTYTVTSNPLNQSRTVGTTTSSHKRVIGTGQMVTEVNAVSDSIGYAFWSVANFNGATSLKYLTVDGVDPLRDSYVDGTVPQAGTANMANVTLSHVKDGSYPVWSMLRLVTTPGNQTIAQGLADKAQAMVSFGSTTSLPDFVPFSQMNVFRAHYQPVGVSFNAGNVPSAGPSVCSAAGPEAGGDAGGLVFSMQAGNDYCILKVDTTSIQNTNSAFGVRQ